MHQPGFDPGLTQKYTGSVRRVIQRDGNFNVQRSGGNWHDFHIYQHLINMGWARFFAAIVGSYLVINTIFALIFYWLGPNQLTGDDLSSPTSHFMTGFFFSAHTLTTVGYGNISPKGFGANIVAVIESMFGVLAFAVATGLLFGRVARPSAKIGFSDTMRLTP
jgi:inward rectifier potassium channel